MNSKATELEQVVPNDIEHRAKNPESHSCIFTSTSVRPSRGGGGGGGGGLGGFLVIGQWGCAAGWGRIFRAGLTIMGLHFH